MVSVCLKDWLVESQQASTLRTQLCSVHYTTIQSKSSIETSLHFIHPLRKYKRFICEMCTPYLARCMKAITSLYQPSWNCYITLETNVCPTMLTLKQLHAYYKLSLKKRMGAQRRTKVAPYSRPIYSTTVRYLYACMHGSGDTNLCKLEELHKAWLSCKDVWF